MYLSYPDPLIKLLAFIRLLFHLPYRQLEGFTRSLSRYVDRLKAPDYTTLDRRVNRLNISIDETLVRSDEPVYIALDSTGIKVHIAVNVKTKQVISLDVTKRYI